MYVNELLESSQSITGSKSDTYCYKLMSLVSHNKDLFVYTLCDSPLKGNLSKNWKSQRVLIYAFMLKHKLMCQFQLSFNSMASSLMLVPIIHITLIFFAFTLILKEILTSNFDKELNKSLKVCLGKV